MNRYRLPAILAVAAAVAATACSAQAVPRVMGSPVASPTAEPEPARTATPTATSPTPRRTAPARTSTPAPISPFTGLPGDHREPVLAVKFDNVRAARPHTGLADADIVYIEPVEGGLGRILAIFSSKRPELIGPIRSARESDLELLRQFGEPAFAYSGAHSRVLPIIGRAPVHDVSPAHAGSAYLRGSTRPAPHNLYARTGELLEKAPKASVAKDIGFRFGPAPAGGRPATEHTVDYPAFQVSFHWSTSDRRWTVSMDGEPLESASGPAPQASTVVVQYTSIRPSRFSDKLGNNTPYTESVGAGRALVLRDGRAYDARWSRPSPTSGTTFETETGEPLTFAPGQVWVVFAKG